jgi:hypothetical protein
MATRRYLVDYHSEINGKFDAHFGHRVALVNAADVIGTDGASRPSPSNIATVISGNNLHNKKSGAVTVINGIANADAETASANQYS